MVRVLFMIFRLPDGSGIFYESGAELTLKDITNDGVVCMAMFIRG